MVTPPFLCSGDTIGIVSTARKISDSEISPLIELIQSWGFSAAIGDSINAEEDQFAGPDEVRTSDLQKMLDDPTIKAIWCARGGYGTVRIVDALDFSTFIKHPKWVIGYSDVTVLHSHIHALGIETLHANMATDIHTKSVQTRSSIRDVLLGNKLGYTVAHDDQKNCTGTASGMLVGGNLSILYSLCGSKSALDTQGKILFIEDLDEYLYHIDRMMMNLKRNNMLSGLKGLIVGGMNDMNDNTIPFGKSAEEIIKAHVAEFNYPVCFGFPAGHIHDNRALIMGRMVNLEVNDAEVNLDFN